MAGSGGGWKWPGDVTKKTIKDLYKDSEYSEKQSQYVSDLNSYFQTTLGDFNDRDVDAIDMHLETIKKALDKDIEGSVEMIFGGSVSKHTYIDGLSDIDMLVKIDGTPLEGKKPKDILDYFIS